MCRKYKQRGASPNLKEVLAKLHGKPAAPHTPVIHPRSDRVAAKNVLARLLTPPVRNELAYITLSPKQIQEI